MKRRFFKSFYAIFLAFPICLIGQEAYFDYDEISLHTIDRISILTVDSTTFHPSVRYQSLSHMKHFLSIENLPKSDLQDLARVANLYSLSPLIDSTKADQGFLKSLYSDPYHLLTVNIPSFFATIDPILLIGGGLSTNEENTVFQNTRGLKVRGHIDNKIYFYTSLYENQRRFYNYIEAKVNRFSALPGQGFYKIYNSSVLGNLTGWDYINAQGYIGGNISKSIDIQFGHGTNFIGNGIRSMILSDYAHNYLYLKFNTHFGPVHYQNIFAELSSTSSKDNSGSQLIPKKYMAAHYLDINISRRLSIGFYESVIFSRNDHFEFQYLNPVILYRTIEQFLDSPDNVLIGLNTHWTPLNGLQFYGQMMIDEFRTDQIFSGNGWWGNKIGYQIGLKHYNILNIDHLDGWIELNSARPYTYAHRSEDLSSAAVVSTSYSHYNQPLAHPLGANFREIIFQLKYQPSQKWFFNLRLVHSNYGDSVEQNVGNDILQNYETRSSNFDNYTGQGVKTTVSLLSFNASWQFHPNYFVDLDFLHRNQNSEESVFRYRTNYLGLALRANMFNQNIDY